MGDQMDPEQQPMFHNVNRGKLSLTPNPPKDVLGDSP